MTGRQAGQTLTRRTHSTNIVAGCLTTTQESPVLSLLKQSETGIFVKCNTIVTFVTLNRNIIDLLLQMEKDKSVIEFMTHF